jgi:hypothetical protein
MANLVKQFPKNPLQLQLPFYFSPTQAIAFKKIKILLNMANLVKQFPKNPLQQLPFYFSPPTQAIAFKKRKNLAKYGESSKTIH